MSKLKVTLILVYSCIISSTIAQNKILFVTSNQEYYGDTKIPASNHFGEIVIPYHVFTSSGFTVDFVSPEGGAIPVGYINTSDSIHKQYLYDGWFMDKLEHTLKPSEIISSEYAAIFYSGGGAAMYDVPDDKSIQRIAGDIYIKNGVISAICHGTAGISKLSDENGKSLFDGKKITGYPDELESKDKDYYKAFPFTMNAAIEDRGGKFIFSKYGNDGFYIVDDRFVTGQDPSSATIVAQEVIKLIRSGASGNLSTTGKSDLEQIKDILTDYIEGTANGEPERLRRAFHPDFNLYTIASDTLWIRSGEKYISNIKVGEKANRIGRILSIDIEKDAAIAKAEIVVPNWRTFIDYFLILRIQGEWKIVHKSYSWKEIPKVEK